MYTQIANLLRKENILRFTNVESREFLIKALIDNLIKFSPKDEFDETLQHSFYDVVLEREKKSSTGIGHSIAFPHGRINGLNKPLIAMAIVKNGIDFNSYDNQPVKLIFLFLFPGNRHDLGVKIQAVMARFLKQPHNIDYILNNENPDLIHKYIEDAKLVIDTPIIALDLMRNVKIHLTKDMPLQEVTRLMSEFSTEVAPVVDEHGELLGEIDCIHLFQMELPDYIKNLHSVPPIYDFNPFRKYFTEDAALTVEKVYNKDVAKIEPQTSLFEIVFLLAVKKHSIVYVCQDDKLIGAIDRFTVLNKIFNH